MDRLDVFDTDELLVQSAEEVTQPVGLESEAVEHRRVETLHVEAGLVAVAVAGSG